LCFFCLILCFSVSFCVFLFYFENFQFYFVFFLFNFLFSVLFCDVFVLFFSFGSSSCFLVLSILVRIRIYFHRLYLFFLTSVVVLALVLYLSHFYSVSSVQVLFWILLLLYSVQFLVFS